MYLQPCDWREYDHKFKYVVDIYGRTHEGDVARVRITDFKPYFYLRALPSETAAQISSAISGVKTIQGMKITEEYKLDAMRGFNGLQSIRVWKLAFPALWAFKLIAKELRNGLKIGNRKVQVEDVFESNLPPYLRLFHERDISPASPIKFDGENDTISEDERVNVAYKVTYTSVEAFPGISIPLYVLSYDIEVYSASGNFPQASNREDEIIQIGLSFRWSDDLMTPVERYVLISGTCEPSPDVKYVSCTNEQDLLLKFKQYIQAEDPDMIVGYNTFGFDDGYIAERCELHHIELQLGRSDTRQWGRTEMIKTEKKTFELASGKYAVRYFDLPGRLPIDLLLSIRREQNLDSYKLDNVASTFLRDKVTKIDGLEIHTKSTRGLFVGNYIRFDVVTNTINPYLEGKKFMVTEIKPKSFVIQSDSEILTDLSPENQSKLEWSFSKDDVSAQDMFELHKKGPADRSKIAKYCIRDCDLVLTLMAKLDTLVNARGMADVCRVPIDFIFLRGQGIKIYSAVAYNASKRNQIIMAQESIDGDMSYEGAVVLPPKIGMYLEDPIPVLDFNSLYPSNMIAFNISPDSLVYVKTFNTDGRKIHHEGADGPALDKLKESYTIDEISFDLKNDDDEVIGRKTCGYAQPTSDPCSIGLLPMTLDILLKKRKETRKLMEKTDDDAQKSVLNGLQLAYKVVANSVYGQTGSRTSPIRKVEVAACTTAVGRAKLNEAKTIVETEFGATVIYGDSVTGYSPVTIKQNEQIKIVDIEHLGMNWQKCQDSDKEYCELQNTYSWTEDGWTPLHRVIRHKLAAHKKIIRVLTHTGMVDVTDDHSLLRLDKTEVSSKTLNIGDELLHHDYPTIESNNNIDHELLCKARVAGFFFGDGSCGVYECPSGSKASWALNNANMDMLKQYVERCSIAYPDFEWIINDTLLSSNVYKLVPRSPRGIKKFIIEYRSDMYVGLRKNIPDWVMNGSCEVRQAFWDGMYDADGDKEKGYIRIDQKHQTTCAQISLLGSLLGYNVSINDRRDKLKIARMTFSKKVHRKNPNAIKKMYEIPYSGYVYDLTTSNHHFQAGIGRMIVHNTDSIFVQFPTKNLAEAINYGKRAADKINALCTRKAHKIEYEKTFFPFILFCRKRYMGLKYEDDPTKCKRVGMGIALKRRDNAPIVKDIFGGALDILMEERSLKNAQNFVKDMLVQVMQNKIPLEKFIITKQLRDDYITEVPEQIRRHSSPGKPSQLNDKKAAFNVVKNYAVKFDLEMPVSSIAHRTLAERMEERDGTAPQVGDRLAYIYVANRKDEKKQGDKIEHIDFVKKRGLKPDVEFYITNQIQNPVAQLFALGIEQLDGYVPRKYTEYPNLDEEEGTLAVLKQKEKDLDSILFLGAQYLKKHKRGPMDMFLGR
uniref:DNA polymerase n=1 Tax=viral metagenome TaxID=1070528 RepID=A0A6C0B1S4_9ZZZZ